MSDGVDASLPPYVIRSGTRPFCQLCNLFLRNENSLNEHLKGKKHVGKVERQTQRKLQEERSIFVYGDLAKLISPQLALTDYFLQFSPSCSINLDPNNVRFAIVEFDDPQIVEKILEKTIHVINGIKLTMKPRVFKGDGNRKSFEVGKDLQERLIGCKDVLEQVELLQDEWKLTAKEMKTRQDVCESIKSACQKILPNCDLVPYGSCANGFGIHGCDLDLHYTRDTQRKEEMTLEQEVDVITKFLPNCSNAVVSHIGERFQLIKFKHKPSQLQCDISIGNELGVRNTEYQLFLCSINDKLKPLVYFIRAWVRHCGVAGQLSSYAITLLVIFFMQNTKRLVTLADLQADESVKKAEIKSWDCSFPDREEWHKYKQIQNNESMVDLLKAFFTFYVELKLRKSIILNLKTAQVENVSDDNGLPQLDRVTPLNIRDPFELTHNVGGFATQQFMRSLYKCFCDARKIAYKKQFVVKEGRWGVLQLLEKKDSGAAQLSTSIDSSSTGSGSDTLPGLTLPLTLKNTSNVKDWPSRTASLVLKILRQVFRAKCHVDGCEDDDEMEHDQQTEETVTTIWCTDHKRNITNGDTTMKITTGKKRTMDDIPIPVKRSKIVVHNHHNGNDKQISLPLVARCELCSKLWEGRRNVRRKIVKTTNLGELDLEQRVSALIINNGGVVGGKADESTTSSLNSSIDCFSMSFFLRADVDSADNLLLNFELQTSDLRSDFVNFHHYLQTFLPSFMSKYHKNPFDK